MAETVNVAAFGVLTEGSVTPGVNVAAFGVLVEIGIPTTPTPIPTHLVANTGYNLSDSADFVTIYSNGVAFPYAPGVAILKNDTGGAAQYTFLTPTPTIYAVRGLTIPNADVTVGDGETWLYPLSSIFIQPDNAVYVDCSVEAQILVLP